MNTQIAVVVVPLIGAAPGGAEALRGCLEALSAQVDAPLTRVYVPYDETFPAAAGMAAAFPDFAFLPQKGRRTYAELRAAGVRRALGQDGTQPAGGVPEVVAVTEDHCRPAADWCIRIWEAHHEGPGAEHEAIGGSVEKETPDSPLGWAVYFGDYVRYAQPFGEGPAPSLTDLNVTYKTSALLAIAEKWQHEFHEPVVHAAIEGRGKPLWISPRILVRQRRPLTLQSILWDRYAFGRLFGATRAAQLPLTRRLVVTVLALIVPALLVLRVTQQVWRKKRWLGEFARAFPYLALISLRWGWGEFIGSLTGRSDPRLTAAAK